MKTFNIRYTYTGRGIAEIEAKSQKEAEDKFFEGEAIYH